MKVKVYWKSKNPFILDPTLLSYTKTVEVPAGTDMEKMEEFAKDDSMDGYVFDKFEILEK